MNQIETNLKKALADAAKKAFDTEVEIEKIVIEIPKDKSHGDYSTNLAMQLTRLLEKQSTCHCGSVAAKPGYGSSCY